MVLLELTSIHIINITLQHVLHLVPSYIQLICAVEHSLHTP